MEIKVEPKDIKYKIRLRDGKFTDMFGTLVIIKDHEVGIGPSRKGGDVYVSLTDIRTGVCLIKLPLAISELLRADTREAAIDMYKEKINLLADDYYEKVLKFADEMINNYEAAPDYEVINEIG